MNTIIMSNKELQLEYNSQREELVIPEYGRHVQKLIEHAKTIENVEMQRAFVDEVVNLMMQIHPQSRNVEDYREKLWKHAYRIANYELKAAPPSGSIPRPEDATKKPDRVGYPLSEAQFRHYGHNVQNLIKKALSMPEGPKRDGFVAVIGSYMKLAYKTWNKEHYVSDDIIKGDLETLSNGQLILEENTSFDSLAAARRRKQQQQQAQYQQNGGDRDRDRDRGDRDRDRGFRDRNDRDRDRNMGRDRDRNDRRGDNRYGNNNRGNMMNRRKK
ncbi:MAG: DUF4290 domain-containing protein [Saprospiraceae bacterium]